MDFDTSTCLTIFILEDGKRIDLYFSSYLRSLIPNYVLDRWKDDVTLEGFLSTHKLPWVLEGVREIKISGNVDDLFFKNPTLLARLFLTLATQLSKKAQQINLPFKIRSSHRFGRIFEVEFVRPLMDVASTSLELSVTSNSFTLTGKDEIYVTINMASYPHKAYTGDFLYDSIMSSLVTPHFKQLPCITIDLYMNASCFQMICTNQSLRELMINGCDRNGINADFVLRSLAQALIPAISKKRKRCREIGVCLPPGTLTNLKKLSLCNLRLDSISLQRDFYEALEKFQVLEEISIKDWSFTCTGITMADLWQPLLNVLKNNMKLKSLTIAFGKTRFRRPFYNHYWQQVLFNYLCHYNHSLEQLCLYTSDGITEELLQHPLQVQERLDLNYYGLSSFLPSEFDGPGSNNRDIFPTALANAVQRAETYDASKFVMPHGDCLSSIFLVFDSNPDFVQLMNATSS